MITGQNKYLYFLVIMLMAGCSYFKKEDDSVVARVEDKVLTLPEVNEVIPDGLSKVDSTLFADDYVKKWVKQELLIKKAEENLIPVMKDVTNELINYRNSLIIYRYKNELMKQKMDTVVSRAEIEQYFNDHRDDFKLNRNIVKGAYVKIIRGLFEKSIVTALCENTTPLGISELRDFCIQYSQNYGIYIENWIEFDIILNNLPVEIPDQESFLARNDRIEATDSDYYYFATIKDYRLINETAPIEYVSENIRNLILNKRKMVFLNKVDDDIFVEGIRNRKFIIYKN